jgi:8-oxo-dGTP pyrophosphatase MutT (NUDIX family)
VTAVVLRDDEVLLVKRSDNGQWGPITGIVDPGEHPALAATREVLEETDVQAEVEHLVWINVTPPVTHVNGDRAQYLDHTFRCRYLGGEAHAADDESEAVGWFDVGNLPDMEPAPRERIVTAVHHEDCVRLRRSTSRCTSRAVAHSNASWSGACALAEHYVPQGSVRGARPGPTSPPRPSSANAPPRSKTAPSPATGRAIC